MAILILARVEFKIKSVTTDKEGHFTMKKKKRKRIKKT